MSSRLYSVLIFPLMSFTICCLCLSSHLAAKSAETSIIDTVINIDVSQDCDTIGYHTSCSGIWNCAYYLCNLTRSNSQIIRVSAVQASNTCKAQGLSWIWKWKTSKTSVIFMLSSIPFELLAIVSIISRKPYRFLTLGKKGIFTMMAVIACSLLTIAEILEDSWTIQLMDTIKDRRPLFVQTWDTLISVALIINLYSAHVFSLSWLNFSYDEFG